jgi:hypothetical protein
MAVRGEGGRAQTEALLSRTLMTAHGHDRVTPPPRRDATAPAPTSDGVGEIAVAYAPVEAFPDDTHRIVGAVRAHAPASTRAVTSSERSIRPMELAKLSPTLPEAVVQPVADPSLSDARPVLAEQPALSGSGTLDAQAVEPMVGT